MANSGQEAPGRAGTNHEKRKIVDRILVVWLQHPQMRLAELINNVVGDFEGMV
jgi:hypothetical protein